MMQAGTPCPLCETPLASQQLPEGTGDEAPMRLVLRGLPVLACPAPHRYFIGQGFPIWLLNTLSDVELGKIPVGNEKGLLFKKYVCGGCGTALSATAGEPRTFSARLAYQETPAFSVDIMLPMYRCDSCGMEQARSGVEIAKLLPAALVHAFKSMGIKAPG